MQWEIQSSRGRGWGRTTGSPRSFKDISSVEQRFSRQHPTMACARLCIAALLAFLVLGAVCADPPKYNNKYDNVDVDRILNNARILNNYIKCLMEEGPCTAEGRELKRTLPDALQTGCDKCSEKQRTTAERVIKHLMDNRARDWDRLLKKYDPTGEYRKKYEKSIKSN